MNDVPALFFEDVVFQFIGTEALLECCDLSGRSGYIASEAYAKRFRHTIWLRNGRLEGESYFNCNNQQLDIETPGRKHLHYITITIRADQEEYSTDLEAMERVLSATKGKHVFLHFETSNISEEIAKWVKSLRLVFDLRLKMKITSDVLKMMRSLVEKNTLNDIEIGDDVEIEEETTQLLVDLLKQKQFHKMYLPAKCSAALKTSIASWRENSSEMVGKVVFCKERFSELQLSSTEFPFEECSEEEDREAERAYPFARLWSCITTNSVLKNQDGSAVYCFLAPSNKFKSVFLFA